MRNERWLIMMVTGLMSLAINATVLTDSVKSDFMYESVDGRQLRLSSLPDDRLTVLVFFDPDCTTCRQELFQMRHSVVLQQAVEQGRAQVLTVCTEGTREAWLKICEEMPAWWTKGISAEEPYQVSAYDLSSLPAIYLLDNDKQVLLRVRDYAQLCELLNE